VSHMWSNLTPPLPDPDPSPEACPLSPNLNANDPNSNQAQENAQGAERRDHLAGMPHHTGIDP
jgi:hypothetical protein